MKSIAFSHTEQQLVDGSKDVTRRLGWRDLKPGKILRAVRQTMGLKFGETQFKLGYIKVVKVNRERLDEIKKADVKREGFPDMTPAEFVKMYCKSFRCTGSRKVTRIEFIFKRNLWDFDSDSTANPQGQK